MSKTGNKKQKVKTFFPGPVGSSERRWSNRQLGTLDQILCETCGTVHKKLPETYSSRIIDSFLGLQLVEECCGKAIDVLYSEFGQEFCFAFLEDFAKNPTNPRFALLRMTLQSVIAEARQNGVVIQKEMDKLT